MTSFLLAEASSRIILSQAFRSSYVIQNPSLGLGLEFEIVSLVTYSTPFVSSPRVAG